MLKSKLMIVLLPAALLLLVFWEPLTTSKTIFHPDFAPYFEKGAGPGFYEMFVNIGRPLSPMSLLWALLPSRLFHLFFYPLMVMGIFLGFYLFLRDRVLPRLACMVGALSLSFSGYLLTLVAAGHRGVFEALLSSVLALLFMDRALRGQGIAYFVLAPIVVSLSLGTQSDVLAMIGLFIAVYGIMACWRYRASIRADRRRFIAGIVVGLSTLIISARPGLIRIRDVYLPERQSIEEREIATETDAEANRPGGLQIRKSEKWEFCTNWSLPLADLPELVVPLIFGTETTDREAPFWGELGRSMGWQPGQPGFRNFRQHTVYIGLIQILLAFYAVGYVLAMRKSRSSIEHNEEDRWQIGFWGVCAIVSLLLTLGRYTPFYRLFFIFPMADTIRCPVKFLHVTNLAVAILAAYGVAFLLRDIHARQASSEAKKQVQPNLFTRRFAIACGGVAIVLFLALIIAKASTPAFTRYWLSMGYPLELHDSMLSQMLISIVRAAFLALLAGGAVFWALRSKSKQIASTLVGLLFVAVVGLDMASVGKRFVRTIDLSVHESRNDAVLDMIQGRNYTPRVLDLLTSRGPHDPLRVNLKHYYAAEIRLLDEELGADSKLLQQGLANASNLTRLLVVTGTEYVLGRRDQIGGLANSPDFDLVGSYAYSGRIVRSSDPARAPIILLRVVNALPRAAIFTKKTPFAEKHELLRKLFGSGWNPYESVLLKVADPDDMTELPGNNTMPDREAVITQSSRWQTDIDVEISQQGFLILNEPYDKAWKASLDGEPLSIMRANGGMMAVKIPDGRFNVQFNLSPGLGQFWISVVPTLALLFCSILVLPLTFVKSGTKKLKQ